jgi:hypothetical protein
LPDGAVPNPSSTAPAERPPDTIIDDRGSVIPYDADGVRQTIRQQRKPVWYKQVWFILGCGWLVFALYKIASNPASFVPTSPYHLGLIGLAFACSVYQNRRARKNPAALTPEAAVLLAINRCGGCGYGLQEVPPTPDGFRKCPECGGTWHTDRVLFRGPHDEGRAKALLARLDTASAIHGGAFDDRGLPLKDPYQWPQGHMTWTPPPNHPTVAALQRKLNTRGKIATALLLAAYTVGISLWLWLSDPQDRETALVIVVCLIITLVLSLVAWRWPLLSRTVRVAALGSGHCPSCWAELRAHDHEPKQPSASPPLVPHAASNPANAPPTSPFSTTVVSFKRVQFDGCRLCWRCLGAWKDADVGR